MNAKYRDNLPQLDSAVFLTDSGMETTLAFQMGVEMPHFAAFDLLRDRVGRQLIDNYYRRHVKIARDRGCGFVLESPTWRANPDWGTKLGYDAHGLDAVNRDAIAMLKSIRDDLETAATTCVISGNLGPRGDGYDPGEVMTEAAACDYHAAQIGTFASAGADMVAALTITNTPEAIGIVRAARAAGMPAAISFTVETDGRLPTGETLGKAIETVDAATDGYAAYFMINCAHPDHFAGTLRQGGDWIQRIRGLRANASRLSHAELDAAEELDDGNPAELGRDYAELLALLPQTAVVGGCCGTDHRHVEAIAAHCVTPARQAA